MEGARKENLASVSSLVTIFENRMPGAAPGAHMQEAKHHRPACSPAPPAGPWENPSAEEALCSGPRTVSRRYLSSLKNKLSSEAWRKSYQTKTCSGPGTQEPEEKRIIRELLETEQAYVARLHLLDQVFFQELLEEARNSKAFPEDVVRLIFSNISSIYQFHAQFFLPELQRRLDDWTATPRIGDVIQKLAPFLKMYSEYVKNFERAAELLAIWTDKSPPFQEVLTRIQSSKASGSLTLQHHMLEPVQRIPRYELLLKEYVQKLPDQSPDRADAQKALDMIFSAAQHSNAAITEMERLQDLWEVYQRLGLEDDIVDPSNTLLREGPVLKISFRRRDPVERYLFLFNNMLLYCVPRVIQVGAQFQVRTRIDVAGMKVRELTDAEFPHSFLVSGKQRTLELQARSQEEMISWMQACQAAIDQIEKRNETFKAAVQGPEGDVQRQELQSEELGLRAPQWVRDKMVTMCMRCQEPFNALTRRRHHCRACGYVSTRARPLPPCQRGLLETCAAQECWQELCARFLNCLVGTSQCPPVKQDLHYPHFTDGEVRLRESNQLAQDTPQGDPINSPAFFLPFPKAPRPSTGNDLQFQGEGRANPSAPLQPCTHHLVSPMPVTDDPRGPLFLTDLDKLCSPLLCKSSVLQRLISSVANSARQVQASVSSPVPWGL